MRPIAAVQGDTDMSNCGVAHRKLLLSQYEDNETCEVVCGTERWQAGAPGIFEKSIEFDEHFANTFCFDLLGSVKSAHMTSALQPAVELLQVCARFAGFSPLAP